MSSCVDEIFLFQKKLNKYATLNEADKVLYYLHKLNHLNVTVSHLEETGVGKTVNALRHQGGKVGEKARGLVNKWKAMVTAEEEEEEEEEAGDNEEELSRPEPVPSRGEPEPLDYHEEEEEEEEEDEEEHCLQIEENNNPVTDEYDEQGSEEEEPQPASSMPHPAYSYSQGGSPGSDDYNPMTSRSDYQAQMAEYQPSTMPQSPRDASSPEWGGNSPEAERNWKNGTSRSPGKKSGREEKERDKEKHRSKGKGKHRDRDSSHERERKKDKHRDKHKEERREEAEDERRSKSHRDKHRDREKHRSRESKHRSEDANEASVVNGYNTPDHKERSSKRDRESERSVEERPRERVEEEHYQRGESTSRESAHQNQLPDRTKPEKERHRERESSSKKEKQKREHREKDESPDRQKKERKSKHHAVADDSFSNGVTKDSSSGGVSSSSRGGERTTKENKGKHRDSKHKHKESSKKDKHKKDSFSKPEVEEQESSADRSKKEKKSKKQTTSDAGFGAVLMGLDSQVKKKKKKRKKDVEKERESGSEDDQPSTSSGYKRSLTSSDGFPDSKKPKLLSTSADRLPKLPALVVPDEKPLLPEITPNYKPLPRVPVKDEPPESCLSRMTEEEALNFVFQSKSNKRSKVYSGKVCGLAYVPSLYESCIRVLQENIDALEYTGGIPFEILRPVLERASAKQLLNLEDFNHYLLDDSDVLWKVHCKRDFKKREPDEMESWREMWIRCSEERNNKLKSLTHNLTEKFLTKAEPKRTTKIAYVDTAAKVPRNVARAQAKYGTAAASALAAKPGKANEVAARKTVMQNVQRAERAANPRPVAAKKKKVAPLMAKTKQFFKKTFRR